MHVLLRHKCIRIIFDFVLIINIQGLMFAKKYG